jgi:hypothetical protein
VSYFKDAQDLSAEVAAAFELFLSTQEGKEAAHVAAAGFDLGDGLPEEPVAVVITSDPETATMLVLGDKARVEQGGRDVPAQVQFSSDANTLHDFLAENYDAGQLARAVEEKRLSVSGPPWSLDALIVLAGAFGGVYRRSLEQRGRTDLLETLAPAPSGVWEVPVPRPEDFVGAVIPARRKFNQITKK